MVFAQKDLIQLKRIHEHRNSSRGVMAAALEKPIYYHFTNTRRAKRVREKNNNILCLFLEKIGLIIKFYKSLSQ